MIKPSPGYAFIIEDEENYSNLEDIGLEMPEDEKKGVGSTGIILSVSNIQQGLFQRLRHWLFADILFNRYKEGQKVIYDKFIASDIVYRKEDGEEIKRLKSIPCDCILGLICE